MAESPGFGIYVHWPFCLRKCPYCDFNSHLAERVDQRRWRAALVAEIEHFAAQAEGRRVSSIFFGGGTPSLMDPETAATVIARVRALWPTEDDLEITLEANPGAAEADRFAAFRAAGVDRLSLGVQSFSDAALKFLGRVHDAAEAARAIERAAVVFPRRSFDLIYALPGQTLADWRAELERGLGFADGHLSAYQLTIEPGTEFARLGVRPADEDTARRLYAHTQDRLARAGLPAYEISNHARPGEECRHNLTYWRGGEYLGVGPGAHGRIAGENGVMATRQIVRPDRWLAAVESSGHGTAARETLAPEARRQEIVMMGLRLVRGLERPLFRRLTGIDPESAVDARRLGDLAAAGFVEADAEGLRATRDGRLRLDAVIAALLA